MNSARSRRHAGQSIKRSFSRSVLAFGAFALAMGHAAAQSYEDKPSSDQQISRTRAVDSTFDHVRESAHICYDTGQTKLLSSDRRPDARFCRNIYAGCEKDACMIIIHGAVKTVEKRVLEQMAADIRFALRQREAAKGQAAFFPTPWTPPGFADPVCSWYHQLGFDCPEGSGLPGGGSSPPGSGVPGTPGKDDNCYLCTLEYVACFVGAGQNLILQAKCEQDFEDCADKRCG